MSFSTKIKFEAAAIIGRERHCQLAELCAFLLFCSDSSDRLVVRADNELALIKISRLTAQLFGAEPRKVFERDKLRELRLDNIQTNISEAAGIVEGLPDPLAIKSDCCKRAFLRGAFIAAGSMNNPDKSYHLQFSAVSEQIANALLFVISFFGLKAAVVRRKRGFSVYMKEAESISDLLNLCGAHSALLEFESSRIEKDVNNNINRLVNSSSANDYRTIDAAARQASEIEKIDRVCGFSALPPQLRELAELRLRFPLLSIKELGEHLTPTLTKSGVNHRLRKLAEIARKL